MSELVFVATACDDTLIFVSAKNADLALAKVIGYCEGKDGYVPDQLGVDPFDEYFQEDSGLCDFRSYCEVMCNV